MLLATSVLGFALAAFLYANTHVWLRDPPDLARYRAQIHRANVVCECLGVYCLLLAVPPAVVTVTANRPVRWLAAMLTLVALIGYQRSGASLLQRHLERHRNNWRRRIVALLGWTFTLLVICLGAWLFVAALQAPDDRLVPALVLVGFLLLVSLYGMWAQPGAGAAASPRGHRVAQSTGHGGGMPAPPYRSPLETNAPPPPSGAGQDDRRGTIARWLTSWLLQVVTLLLVIATFVAVIIVLHDEHNADAQSVRTARYDTAAALSSAAALEAQALQAQHNTEVVTGELTSKVYVTRLREAMVGLLSVLRTRVELQPAVPLSDLHVSVDDGIAILRTKADPHVLTALGNFSGQMHITYDNFHRSHKRHKLTPRDHLRVCRTIKFGNVAVLDFRGVSRTGVAQHPHLTSAPQCSPHPRSAHHRSRH
jgi:uncharacterized protein with GYD domain